EDLREAKEAYARLQNRVSVVSTATPPQSKPDALVPASPQTTRRALWLNPETKQEEAIEVADTVLRDGVANGTLRPADADADTRALYDALSADQERSYADLTQRHGWGTFEGMGEAALSGLTLGLHKGLYSEEKQARFRQWMEENPGSYAFGNTMGFILPMLLTWGGSSAVTGAVKAAEVAGKAGLAARGRAMLNTVSSTTLGKAVSLGGGGLGMRGAGALTAGRGTRYQVLEGATTAPFSALMATMESEDPSFEEFGQNLAVHGGLGVVAPLAITAGIQAAGGVYRGGARLLGRTRGRPEMNAAQQRAAVLPETPAEQQKVRDELLAAAATGDVAQVQNYLNRMIVGGSPDEAIQSRKLLRAMLSGRTGMDQDPQALVQSLTDEVFMPLLEAQQIARFGKLGDYTEPAGVAELAATAGTRLHDLIQGNPAQAQAVFLQSMESIADDLAEAYNAGGGGGGTWALDQLKRWFGDIDDVMVRGKGTGNTVVDVGKLQKLVAERAAVQASGEGGLFVRGALPPRKLVGTTSRPNSGRVTANMVDDAGKPTTIPIRRSAKGWRFRPAGTKSEWFTMEVAGEVPQGPEISAAFEASGVFAGGAMKFPHEVEGKGWMGKLGREMALGFESGNAGNAFAAVNETRKTVEEAMKLPAGGGRAVALSDRTAAIKHFNQLVDSTSAWGEQFQVQAAKTREAYSQLATLTDAAPEALKGLTAKNYKNPESVKAAVQQGLFGGGQNNFTPHSQALMQWVGKMIESSADLLAVRGGGPKADALLALNKKAVEGISKRVQQLEVLEAVNQLSYKVPGSSRSQSWQRAVGEALLGVPGLAARMALPWQASMLMGSAPIKLISTVGKQAVLDAVGGGSTRMAGQAVREQTAQSIARERTRTFKAVTFAEETLAAGETVASVDYRRTVGVDRWILGLLRSPSSELRLSDDWGPGEPTIEERYTQLSDDLDQLSGSPQAMLTGLSSATESLYDADPSGAFAGAYGDTVARALAYAVQHMPSTPADPLTGQSLPPARAEIKEWFYTLEALDDPNVICEYVATGLVKQSGVQAVREAYPEQFAQYVLAFAQKALATGSKLTYAQKLILGEVTGMNLDPTEESSFIMAMNQDYSQTPEQSAALGQAQQMQAQGNAQAIAFQQAARRLPGSTGSTAQGHRNDLERLGQA
ncbi:MAG: hypothetical protein GY842_06330, partial [bacterium]|nr:hypothetical protein [bacterium]